MFHRWLLRVWFWLVNAGVPGDYCPVCHHPKELHQRQRDGMWRCVANIPGDPDVWACGCGSPGK